MSDGVNTINRQITVKGEFKRAVIVNDTFVNGENCEFVNTSDSTYSHAEGYHSLAAGKYSHADGVSARTTDDYSYVWSGTDPDETSPRNSNGPGTFSVYTSGYNTNSPSCTSDGLSRVYVNGQSLYDTVDWCKNQAINTIRNEDNTFKGNLNFNGSEKTLSIGENSILSVNGESNFTNKVAFNNSDTTAQTKDSSTSDDTLATCKFVHTTITAYLTSIFGSSIFTDAHFNNISI